MAETEISTNPTKAIAYSYLWFGGLPVASIEASTNTTRWYLSDHLGTPLLQTNASGAVVWRAEHAPYGTVFAFRTGATLHQPLRLPGQVAQDSGETHYNVFRWYRPSWGRFTQLDPSGREAGRYAYVSDAPTANTDPLGTTTCMMKLGAMLQRPDAALTFVAAVLQVCGSDPVKDYFMEASTPRYFPSEGVVRVNGIVLRVDLGVTDPTTFESYVYKSAFDRGAYQVVQTSGHEAYHQLKLRRRQPMAGDELAADAFGWMAGGQFTRLTDCECDLCR
jgi:RHS repeat-associated protein